MVDMRRIGVRTAMGAVLMALGCASAPGSSSHQDFSGTWVLSHSQSRLQVPAPDSTIFVIQHREPDVRVFRMHARAGALDTATLTLRTDSSEMRWEIRGVQATSHTWWTGNELRFWTAFARGDQRWSQVVTYSLSDGRFVAVEYVDAGSASHLNRWVFDRRK